MIYHRNAKGDHDDRGGIPERGGIPRREAARDPDTRGAGISHTLLRLHQVFTLLYLFGKATLTLGARILLYAAQSGMVVLYQSGIDNPHTLPHKYRQSAHFASGV